jgi:UDP-N-acetylmuramyl pentapeptide phosphotransferase/UDP-N-acetylglucosamine-1-phosphate transferase
VQLIIAGVSFWDDVSNVSQRVRLLFHLLAMSCAFYMAGVYGNLPWWAIVIGYIGFIGTVNAYNFMDGINGITGLYSLAVLGSLQYVNFNFGGFVNDDLIWYPMIASVVFLFFNFRGRAKCFAGDVGSVAIAFWVLQLACSVSIVFLYPVYGWWVFFALLAVLMGLYMLKFPLMHIVK